MSEIAGKVADLINDCELRQGELFEEKFPSSEGENRAFFDTTDISNQARDEYAVRILKFVAGQVGGALEIGPTQTDLDCFDSSFAMGLREGARRERAKTLVMLREA